jgi:hypothetical protein
MILTNISINIVRNQNEYEKYVYEEYRKKYTYEESKPSLPWLVISFDKAQGDNITDNCILQMTPVADFTNINAAPNGEWSVGTNKNELTLNLDKLYNNVLMLEVKKDCGFSQTPNNLTVIIKDNNGKEFRSSLDIIDFSQKETLLKNIEEKYFQQGEDYLAKIVYELIQQGKI